MYGLWLVLRSIPGSLSDFSMRANRKSPPPRLPLSLSPVPSRSLRRFLEKFSLSRLLCRLSLEPMVVFFAFFCVSVCVCVAASREYQQEDKPMTSSVFLLRVVLALHTMSLHSLTAVLPLIQPSHVAVLVFLPLCSSSSSSSSGYVRLAGMMRMHRRLLHPPAVRPSALLYAAV